VRSIDLLIYCSINSPSRASQGDQVIGVGPEMRRGRHMTVHINDLLSVIHISLLLSGNPIGQGEFKQPALGYHSTYVLGV